LWEFDGFSMMGVSGLGIEKLKPSEMLNDATPLFEESEGRWGFPKKIGHHRLINIAEASLRS
jgi:hypothetical protein